MISLSEFAEKYVKDMNNVLHPYQERMLKIMESLQFKNGSEITIFGKPSGKSEVFDYFYTHWKLENGKNHMVGQQCEGDTCPICKAVEAIADVDFIKADEMTI
jgi:ABC-type transport system involved in cytochrome bd biosynthesis fused ATPase/permease subunit